MDDPTFQIHTHITQETYSQISSQPRPQDENRNTIPNTIGQYQIVRLSLKIQTKIQYQIQASVKYNPKIQYQIHHQVTVLGRLRVPDRK